MTLDTLEPDLAEPDPAEVVALLQPYVDGELSDEERELVAGQIATNPDYEAIVREQREVQALLRGLERELAPAELRERVLADLDAVEAEQREAERSGWLAPVVGRIKAFGRGAMLMVPAVAAAGALFFVASNAGWIDSPMGEDHIDGGMASSLRVAPRSKASGVEPGAVESSAGEVAPDRAVPERADPADPGLPSAEALSDSGFAVQVAPPRSLPSGVALVNDSVQRPGSSAMVRYRDEGGAVMVDHQRRAGVAPLQGAPIAHEGHEYHLGRDAAGRAFVEFHLGRVHHSLMLEGERGSGSAAIGADEPDFTALLSVATALRGALDQP